jgi:sigma-B regulation protein RsbU (phosphoserine phosphatase)
MFYAIYDANDKTLNFTQAGHPEGFVLRPGTKEVISLKSESPLVGAFSSKSVNYSEAKIQLQVGDKFLLYTDALLELWNRDKVMLNREQFISFLVDNSQLPIKELLESIKQFGLHYSGKETFNDDFTMVGFEVLK